jgi:dTDP-glucose 4,6-dehydratase
MNILVTGGAGFIGSNLVQYLLNKYPAYKLVNLDKLTYAGNLANLEAAFENPHHMFVRGDIGDAALVQKLFRDHSISAVIHCAAESHVDRSIHGSEDFLRTNVLGTEVLLEAARKANVVKFVQVSTDEVYGSLGPEGKFTEETPLNPSNPYAASKAAGDLLVLAFHRTYGFPAVVTRCSNNYGQFQFPEKLIPLVILRALADKPLPLYGDGQNVRDWIHVYDHCAALDAALHKGAGGSVYVVGSDSQRKNIDVVEAILSHLGKPESLITFVKDRPGHDRRYATDARKIRSELGWHPSFTFEIGLKETVNWYRNHPQWWTPILSGEYQKYYEQMYGNR